MKIVELIKLINFAIYNQNLSLRMNDQFYKRANELLYQRTYSTYHFSSNIHNQYVTPEFDRFFLTILQRYIDASDTISLFAKTFTPNSSDYQFKTSELMRKLQQVTGERRCCQNLKYFLDTQQEVKRLRGPINKINESIAQLKYYQFPLVGQFQAELPGKIKKIVNAINVYESFIIGVSAQQRLNKLEGGQREAYQYYKNNDYIYTSDMVSGMASIIQYKEDLLTLKEQLINNLATQHENPQTLQLKHIRSILRSLWISKKEFEQIPKLFDKMIPYIQQKKEIPTKYTLAPQINNPTIVDSYNSLCRAIRISYSQSSSSTSNSSPPSYKIIYRGSHSPQRVIIPPSTPSYLEFVDFLENLYSKVDHTADKISLFDKMSRIEQAINNQKSYSADIIEEVTSFSHILNPFMADCFNFFNVRKILSVHSSLAFEFSLSDLEALSKAIKNRLLQQEPNRKQQKNIIEQYEQLKRINFEQQEFIKQTTNFKEKIIEVILKFGSKLNIYAANTESQCKLIQKHEEIASLCDKILRQIDQLREKTSKRQGNSGQFQVLGQQLIDSSEKPEVPSISDKLLEDLKANQSTLNEKENIIKQLQQSIRQARQNIGQLQIQVKRLTQQVKNKEGEFSRLIQAGIQQRQADYQIHLQKAKQQAYQQVEKYRSELSSLKHENQIINQERLKLRNELQELIYLNKQEQNNLKRAYDETINELSRSNAKNIQTIQILTNELRKVEQLNGHLKEQNQMLKENAEDLNQRYTQRITEDLNRTINSISKANSMWQNNDILHELEEGEPHLHKQVQSLHQEYQKHSAQLISELQKTEKNLQAEVVGLREQLASKIKQIQELSRQNTVLMGHIQSQKKAKENMLLQMNQGKKRAAELEGLIQKLKTQKLQSTQNSQGLYCSPIRLSSLPAMLPYTSLLFNDDIFRFDSTQKEKLIYHLESYASSRIKATNLIYKFDTRNKSNFHHYLDEVKNLTLVVKTGSAIIAGFYPGVYKDKEMMDKGGLLVSVTNNQSYQLHQPKKDQRVTYKGMIYDSYFVIYGNAEIRIRIGYKTVFSNFGINNSYFNSRGHKIDAFLNEGDKRQVEFLNYEFYEVIFEEEGTFRQTK